MTEPPRLASQSIAGQRPYQEDAVLAKTLSDGRVLVAVADGMGGHAAGEVASALALEVLESSLEEGKGIDKAFALANRRVHEKARDPGKKGMGTTLTAALVEDGEYMVANVGDSRGYLVSSSEIRQITEDHSFVAEAMKRGQTEAEAKATPWKDALTRSIGTAPDVEIDVFGPFPVEMNTALLICSDGLYKVLDDDELRRLLVESPDPEKAVEMMADKALAEGSDDNISVVLAEYGEVPRMDSQGTMPMDFDPAAQSDDPGPVGSSSPAGYAAADPRSDPEGGSAVDPDAEDGEADDTEATLVQEPITADTAPPDEQSPMDGSTGAVSGAAPVEPRLERGVGAEGSQEAGGGGVPTAAIVAAVVALVVVALLLLL